MTAILVGWKWILLGILLVPAFAVFAVLHEVLGTISPEKPYSSLLGYISILTFIAAFFAFWKAYDVAIDSLSEHQRQEWVLESRKDYRLLPTKRRGPVKFGVLIGIALYVVTIVLLMLVVIVFLSVSQEDISRQIDGLSLSAIAWPVLVTAFFAPNLIWRWARNLESLRFTKENVPDNPEGDGGI